MDLEQELKLAREMNVKHVMHATEDAAFIEMLVEAFNGLYEEYEYLTTLVIKSAEENIKSSEHSTGNNYMALEMMKLETSTHRVTYKLVNEAHEVWKKARS